MMSSSRESSDPLSTSHLRPSDSRSSRREARILEMKGGARERSSSLPKFVIQHPSPDRSSVGSQGNVESQEGAKRKSEPSKNLSRVSFTSSKRADSVRSGASSTSGREEAANRPNTLEQQQQPYQILADVEADSTRISSSQKGLPGSAGHSSDDASTSSGPAIQLSSIEGNKRTSNKVESWLRKASQKKEEIAKEQKQRDENVNEYLRMAQNADKAQQARLKQIFEKRNLKHNVEIHKAQKELEKYLHKVEDLTGTPPALKKVKEGTSTATGSPVTPHGGVKGKDNNLIDNLGQGLKSVGANIREGITDLGGTVIAKPRDLATSIHSALRQKRFGSADNIHQMDDTPPTEGAVPCISGNGRNGTASSRRTLDHQLVTDYNFTAGSTSSHPLGPSSSAQGLASEATAAATTSRPTASHGNAPFAAFASSNNNKPSDDENSSLNSGAESLGGGGGGSLGGLQQGVGAVGPFRTAHSASPTHKPLGQLPYAFPGQPYPTQDYQMTNDLPNILSTLAEVQSEMQTMKEAHETNVEIIKAETAKLQDEMGKIQQHLEEQLREAQYRYERLEEQMNDNTELHQNELLNLKQDLTQFAVKEELERVEYRSRERSDELNEQLEACDNRVQRMEKQAQDAQMLTLEGLEATSLSSLPKLINIVLQLLGLVIVIINTACSVIMPFLKTKVRLLTTIVLMAALFVMHHQRNFMWNILSHIVEEYRHLTAIQ